MYKLRLKFENPVIDLVMAFRETQKESGSLKFNPWICDAQDVIELQELVSLTNSG